MLSPNDVIGLEDRWKRWSNKRLFKRFSYGVLAILLPVSCWYSYGYFTQTKPLVLQDSKPLSLNPVDNNSQSTEPLPHEPTLKKSNETSTPTQKPRLALSIQPVPLSNENKLPLPKNETIELDKEETPHTKEVPLQKTVVSTLENGQSTQTEQTPKTPEPETSPKESGKIQIDMQPSNADTTDYLKDKFDATGNIVFALMVSEEYYHAGQYNDAIRWALTANELDPKNERSWILFAQSKAKLNHPQEAIMALEEFLKSNNSGKIESLLIKLKRGTF
jgi:hypothetical protein